MENMTFHIQINASPKKVWNTLFTNDNYPKWTAVFCTGSHVVNNWQQGSKALFMDDKLSGMISILDEVIPNEFMSIKGIGAIKNGVEDNDNPDAKACNGALEQYTLKGDQQKTLLTVKR